MANKLKNLVLDEVSLVDTGANKGARISLFKRGATVLEKKIVRREGQWCVTTEDGRKTLGCHDSHAAALRHLRAIEANKGMSALLGLLTGDTSVVKVATLDPVIESLSLSDPWTLHAWINERARNEQERREHDDGS